MTSGQLQFKSWFLYVAKSYGFKGDAIISSCFISHLCIAIQKLPSKVDSSMLQFSIHNDQWPIIQKLVPLCCQKLRFWGWCKIPSCSFPIVALQSNFPNRQYKTSSDSWLLILLWVYLQKYSSSRKNCSRSYCFSTGQDRKSKNGVFHISSFWLGM